VAAAKSGRFICLRQEPVNITVMTLLGHIVAELIIIPGIIMATLYKHTPLLEPLHIMRIGTDPGTVDTARHIFIL
jgi:hypothetical protein